jgi:hypothetical protein
MLVAVTVSVGGLSLLPNWRREQRSSMRWAGFWLACLCLVVATQLVFYNASWPVTVMRYGYPGLLYYPASILILYTLARDLLAGYTPEEAAQLALKASLLASLVVVIVYHEGYAGSIRAMRANVAETGEFTTRLEGVAARLREDETVQLVLESSGIRDWEAAVQGYPRFLAAYQVHNPLFLRMSGYGAASFSPGLDQRLADELDAISMNGNGDYLPLASLEERPGRCLSFYLSSEYPTGCEPFR